MEKKFYNILIGVVIWVGIFLFTGIIGVFTMYLGTSIETVFAGAAITASILVIGFFIFKRFFKR